MIRRKSTKFFKTNLLKSHLHLVLFITLTFEREKYKGAVNVVAIAVAVANAVHRLKTNLEQNFVSNVI